MALINCDFFSEVLGISTSMCVILPQNTTRQIGMEGSSKRDKYPTLYLLHGLSDDQSIWTRRTSIERYVSELGIAVIMPAGNRSFYTDMAHGYNYWTFISEELPAIARSFFHLSDKREDNFVAGLSMGGYGAFKLALRCQDKFAAAASLSGGLGIVDSLQKKSSLDNNELVNVFGDLSKVKGSSEDLFYLAKKASENSSYKTKLYQCCGTEDFLYEENVKFRDYAKSLSLDLTYDESPGIHEWGYWDAQIQKVLKWLPLNKSI